MRRTTRGVSVAAVAVTAITFIAPVASSIAEGGDTGLATSAALPSQPTSDLVKVIEHDLEPVACPAFIELGRDTGGGVFGAVLIDADGDVYLAQPLGRGYTRYYDCPPY